MSANPPITALSAPGKVLLAGGYLVLDKAYTGFVFGLSARITVVAQEILTSEGVQLSEIVVDSPQFLEAQWRYGYHLADEDGGIKVTQLQIGDRINANPFVETTLSYVLTYISRAAQHQPTHSIKPARLTILADNDYYSHGPVSSSSSSSNPTPTSSRFARFPVRLSDAHKTGLGSSAALVTALTASLLAHYLGPDAFDPASPTGRATLHNLAQAAHCAAQGKVGSGFDVAAAVYGSCRYRRFSPSVLADLPVAGGPKFAAVLEGVVHGQWDTETDPAGVRLPPGVAVRMCDVDCGSQTVGMVKQVLAWRVREPERAKTLWDELQRRNEALAAVLSRPGPAAPPVDDVRAALHAVRALVREMGDACGVPIEPASQTALLDALEGVEGVYGGVVPGAGGFDALALLVRDDEATAERVHEFLEGWSREKGGKVTLLPVKGEMEGVRKEGEGVYKGWVESA